jgi:4-hydroxy-tetrahydrodipicolinate synthase
MPNLSAELIPAMVTPFKRDESIDYEKVEQLAVYLVNNGCDGLLVNGTTGEGPTLTLEEKIELVKVVKNAVHEKPVQIMVGIGSNDTNKSVEEARKMASLGIHALLVVVPYYNKPSQAGMIEHFRRIAQAVAGTEIVIYNIPSRCGVLMSPDTMLTLHKQCPNIIGVKQSHPDMDQVSEITDKLPKDTWRTWCGDDSLTVPMIACGAYGTISVLAHLTGKMLREMIQAAKRGDREQALKLHLKQLNLAREIFFLPNPTIIKTCLAKLGMMEPVLRSPMIPPDDQEMVRIEKLMLEYKNLVPQAVS